MKNIKKIIIIIILSIIITGCNRVEYELNKQVTLKGIITSNEVFKDGKKYQITYLNLDKPIIINDTKVTKIAIDYNKLLKNDIETSIQGTIITNKDQNIDLSYAIKVNDIDNILSYINTFSNEYFSVTIPTEIIKLCNIEKIDNGFNIYKTNENNEKINIFKILSVTNDEFNNLRDNEQISLEKVTSNKERTIIILYSLQEYDDTNYEEYDKIIKNIDTIKDTIVIK